jgi:hypothetical protein
VVAAARNRAPASITLRFAPGMTFTHNAGGPSSRSRAPSAFPYFASVEKPRPSNTPAPRSTLEQFRSKNPRLKLHPLELAVLWLVSIHLIQISWMLGGMRPLSHWISLGLSVITFVVALIPRHYIEEHTGGPKFRLVMWPKLIRFPIFWLGLALLLLITIQGLNPSWSYRTDGKSWWMEKIPHIGWLPTGVDVPFANWGPWRMLVIYASVLLTVCSVWVGFTRRRPVQIFAIVIAGNGLALTAIGLAQKFTGARKILWFAEPAPAAAIFSTFVYKNHGGAFLFLSLVTTIAVAGWFYLRGIRRLEKSNPSGLFAFFGTCIAVGIVASYARGATLTTITFLLVALGAFFAHQIFGRGDGSPRWAPLIVSAVVFAIFAKTGYEALRLGESWQRIAAGLASRGHDLSLKNRFIANKASSKMLRDHWPQGVGAGSFSFIFPEYQQRHPEIWQYVWNGKRQYWSHAHNDLLQLPIELGVPGVIIILGALALWAVVLIRHYFWQNPFSLLLAFGALLFVGYSYFDFPFYNPACLLLWCLLWPIAAIWAKLEESGSR